MKKIVKRHTLLFTFIISFVLLFFFLGYPKIINTGPTSIHAWRQSDSYCFALTYFYENNKLLAPSMLFIGEDGHGKTVSEFPILYFITAKIWKVSSVNPAVLKFINFLILLIGLFHLTLILKSILKDNFWAMVVTLILYSSPILGYYAFNFIPNTPAFGLALCGLYYLHAFAIGSKNKHLLLFTLFFAVAALLKVSALISFLGATVVLLWFYLENRKQYKSEIIKVLLALICVVSCYFIWYKYSIAYNTKNLTGIFNQSTIPVWKLNWEQIKGIAVKFNHNVFPWSFHRATAYVLLSSAFLIAIFGKGVNKHIRRATLIYMFGNLAFMALFFQGLDVHDYFLTNTLIVIPLSCLSILLFIQNKFPRFFQSVYSKIAAVAVVLFLLNYCIIITRSRYNPHTPLVKYNIPLSQRQRDFWEYNHYIWEITDSQYEGLDKYLREIGLDYNNTKIITLGDYTPNKTLCLMQMRGFPEYLYHNNFTEEEKIPAMQKLGATHLVVCGDEYKQKEFLQPYTKHLIGTYKKISVFELPIN